MHQASNQPLRRLNVMGAPLDVGTLKAAASELITTARDRSQKALVLHRDANGVVQRLRRTDVADAETQATHVFPDGIPMCWLARLCGFSTDRLYGPDLMQAVCQECSDSEIPLRHAVAGGAPGVAAMLAREMMDRYPGLQVEPCALPMIDEPAKVNFDLVKEINALKPDILWVGLGCPKQDL